ncbi:hypothetical protein P4N68_09625 [Corynebacterium felinum]|uniref:Uncharacterized protein n=1 Tax=Corynebacterium felinum TaxID=131318 RepID=A0ABU2BB50_9CORY|nr:hypothetical protein [Corynebacterium felinum]MDF5821335.1 hypothetical protein [Corynebacterium felinum]MDR7355867.1 hypothetical protein [Corynebacterium felinum]WJY95210.1 hypothetical protein CFELI_08020 [Corynebacterium felinum]
MTIAAFSHKNTPAVRAVVVPPAAVWNGGRLIDPLIGEHNGVDSGAGLGHVFYDSVVRMPAGVDGAHGGRRVSENALSYFWAVFFGLSVAIGIFLAGSHDSDFSEQPVPVQFSQTEFPTSR